MPLRAYFIVIGPVLAAFLWWTSWYMQPEPVKFYPAAAAQTTKPAAATSALASARAADVLLAAPSAGDTTAAVQAPKQKKRKVAQRRKPRDGQGSTYASGNPAALSPYASTGSQSYAGYQPFFGYNRW